VTVVWKNGLCQHSGICAHGLRVVFNPQVSPWINMEAANTEQIIVAGENNARRAR